MTRFFAFIVVLVLSMRMNAAYVPSLIKTRPFHVGRQGHRRLFVSSPETSPEAEAEMPESTGTSTEEIQSARSKNVGFAEEAMLSLPRHSDENVDLILRQTEEVLQALQDHSKTLVREDSISDDELSTKQQDEKIYANAYVDLAKCNVIGFDYDYTLVTYTEELLDLIYDMALRRLVKYFQYPAEMLRIGLKFDPFFSIRGLAVDKETGWICHLSYTHKVSVAWEGRARVPTSKIYQEYRGKRAMRPSERRKRLKPLNDLFSMAECCLIGKHSAMQADSIQSHATPHL